MKEVSMAPKILSLYDSDLGSFQNKIIFDLLAKSISDSIEKIRDTYEVVLEVNKTESCFVLHCQNEAFEAEPIQ